MKQIFTMRRGGTDVLQLNEVPATAPLAGQISIDVRAAGVNFADILIRQGIYPGAPPFPIVVGYEVAGDVIEVGANVDHFAVGDRVVAMTEFGGYGEQVVIPADQAVSISDAISFDKAAAIPVNYVTAWLMLVHLGNVKANESVLIHAVAGGVGQAAVQICQLHNATIIGTASAAKHSRLREAGVQHCIDYRNDDFEKEVMKHTEGKGVDIALDGIGGASFTKSYRCLAPLGRLFMYGVSSMVPRSKRSLLALAANWLRLPSFKPLALLDSNRGVFGISLGHLKHKRSLRIDLLRHVVQLVEEGQLSPVLDRSFSFEEAGAAQQYLHDRKNFGKVVLSR